MEQERKQEIALMRYSAIAPLVTGLDIEGSQLDRMDIAVLGKNQEKEKVRCIRIVLCGVLFC